MLIGLMIQVAIEALVLCGLLYLIARHEADFNFGKLFVVSAVIVFVALMFEVWMKPKIGWFVLLFDAGFVLFMLTQYCWVSVPKGLIVTVIFMLVQVVFAMVFLHYKAQLDKDAEKSMALVNERQKDMIEAQAMMMDALQGAYIPPPPADMGYSGGPGGQSPEAAMLAMQSAATSMAAAAMQQLSAMQSSGEMPTMDKMQDMMAQAGQLQQMQMEALRRQQQAMMEAEQMQYQPYMPPARTGNTIELPPGNAPAVQEAVPAVEPAPAETVTESVATETVVAQEEEDPWIAAEKRLILTGTVGSGQNIVVLLNGRPTGLGEEVSVKHNGMTYRWTLKSVGANNKLELEKLDAQ